MKNESNNSTLHSMSIDSAFRTSRSTYSRVAMMLHWLIAVLVLSTIAIGWFSTWGQVAPTRPAPSVLDATTLQPAKDVAIQPSPPSPKSAAQQSATNAHKTIGVVILFLTFFRIGWRITHRPPSLPEEMGRLLRWIARASHSIFYLLLLVMPLSGWWMSSAVPNPRRHAFGVGIFDIPFLPVTQSWPAAGIAKFIHTSLVWLMVGLVVLHICAALKHHFIDKDDVLQRMLPRKFH